jgi:two-component system response regulator PhoP
MKLLLIEDDENLRDVLEKRLKEEGFIVDSADNGEDGLYLGREYAVDIAVIDLGLPKVSGMEVIQTLRDEGHSYPILVLTARGSWQDKVMGLDAGADDYLVKPFHFPELLARVKALVRRSAGFSSPELICGDVILNSSTGEVKLSDTVIDLTSYEYKVLEYMMLHQGEVVSKTTLTEHIYHQDYDRDSNVIEVFVGRLRRKLTSKNSNHKVIETLRGRGYRMSPPSIKNED